MFELIMDHRSEAQWCISILVLLAAVRWGSAPDRIVAFTFVGLFTLPNLLALFVLDSSLLFTDGGLFYAAMDIVAAVVFTGVALNANRNYPLWVAGFQLVAVAAHGVRFLTDVVSTISHAILVIGPSYFQLLFMAVGLFRHLQRQKRHGKYRDWRIARRELDFAALTRGPG